MAPDLNSLSAPANSTDTVVPTIMTNNSDRPLNLESPPSPSPRSTSLQAAATLNAGLQREQPSRRSSNSSISRNMTSPVPHSPSTGHRRSQVLMNLQIADPSIPAPGEMVSEPHNRSSSPHVSASPQPLYADPHHYRTPSLGDLHQSLENEQEFQVNRLLNEIRRLQLQVQRQQSGQLSGSAIGDDSAPPSAIPTSGSLPRSPGFPIHPRSSFDMARADLSRRSRTPSRGASPRLRATSIGDNSEQMLLGGRDESAFYQAETQMLVRENQMLRHRIRELEKQLSEVSGTAANSSITHEPAQASHLHRSTSVSEESARQPDPTRQAEPMARPHPNTLTENPKGS